jgi:hypothetical protein
MNVDQFRRLLDAMATPHDPTDTSGQTRLDGVAAKIAHTRRVRATAGLGGLAAVVAIAALVAPAVERDRNPSPPAATGGQSTQPIDLTPTDLPTVTDNGTVFYEDAAGMRLIGHEVADPGRHWLSLTVVPRTLNLEFRSVCWRLKDLDPRRGFAQYSAFVNGTRVDGGGGDCVATPYGPLQGDSAFDDDSLQTVREFWSDLGVVPGRPTHIRMHVRGSDAAVAASQLAFGFFTGGERRHYRSAWYRAEVVWEGREYRSHGVEAQAYTGRRWILRHGLPSGDPAYFVIGGTLDAHQYGTLHLWPGEHGSIGTASPEAGVGGLVPSGRGPARIVYRADSPSGTGRLWMTVYRRTR